MNWFLNSCLQGYSLTMWRPPPGSPQKYQIWRYNVFIIVILQLCTVGTGLFNVHLTWLEQRLNPWDCIINQHSTFHIPRVPVIIRSIHSSPTFRCLVSDMVTPPDTPRNSPLPSITPAQGLMDLFCSLFFRNCSQLVHSRFQAQLS